MEGRVGLTLFELNPHDLSFQVHPVGLQHDELADAAHGESGLDDFRPQAVNELAGGRIIGCRAADEDAADGAAVASV